MQKHLPVHQLEKQAENTTQRSLAVTMQSNNDIQYRNSLAEKYSSIKL